MQMYPIPMQTSPSAYLGLVLGHLGRETLGCGSHSRLAVPQGCAHEGEAPAQSACYAALPVGQQLCQLLRLLPGLVKILHAVEAWILVLNSSAQVISCYVCQPISTTPWWTSVP